MQAAPDGGASRKWVAAATWLVPWLGLRTEDRDLKESNDTDNSKAVKKKRKKKKNRRKKEEKKEDGKKRREGSRKGREKGEREKKEKRKREGRGEEKPPNPTRPSAQPPAEQRSQEALPFSCRCLSFQRRTVARMCPFGPYFWVGIAVCLLQEEASFELRE